MIVIKDSKIIEVKTVPLKDQFYLDDEGNNVIAQAEHEDYLRDFRRDEKLGL